MSLLMPHWPEVVARLDGLHGNHADEEPLPDCGACVGFSPVPVQKKRVFPKIVDVPRNPLMGWRLPESKPLTSLSSADRL